MKYKHFYKIAFIKIIKYKQTNIIILPLKLNEESKIICKLGHDSGVIIFAVSI